MFPFEKRKRADFDRRCVDFRRADVPNLDRVVAEIPPLDDVESRAVRRA